MRAPAAGDPEARACTSIIARLRMSAALPWIGMLTATRSARAADLAVPAGQVGHQAAAAEHRLHDAGLARASSSRPSMKRADRREAGEVRVDELLRLLRETPMSFASVNACFP